MSARFQHLFDVISGQRFLQMRGLGNEVPFFICHYRPEESIEMDRTRVRLTKRLEQVGVTALNLNLYDMAVRLLQERGIWEHILETESSVDKDELKELLQGVLDSERHLIPSIAAAIAQGPYDVLFISGVGEVYPYIRSHNVLNNLQSTAKDHPTVMFFPGEYRHSLEAGASLDLFGQLHDDKYYRAFDIFLCEPELRTER